LFSVVDAIGVSFLVRLSVEFVFVVGVSCVSFLFRLSVTSFLLFFGAIGVAFLFRRSV
jgi:hypothetical protein